MNSFELNKVAGAVLGTLLFVFGTGFLAELIYTPKPAGKAGYALPGGGEGGEHGGAAPAGGGGEAAAPKEGIAALLASADAEKGKAGTKACQACHSFEKGGPNKMGPDLWEVVGRKKGSHEGFGYSEAMKAKGGDWTFEDLDHFLTKPGEYVKGTKMAFQGIANAQERANVIAYLRTLSENPKPLPAAEKKEEPKKEDGKKDESKKDDAKPAEGDKKPAGESKPDAKAAETPAEPEKKAEEAKPAESKPAEDKPAAGEKKTEDAKPAEAPAPAQQPEATKGQGQGQQNEAPPAQAPEAKPAGAPEGAKPEAPSSPNATEPAAKPDPAAEEKAKQEQKPDEKPAQQ